MRLRPSNEIVNRLVFEAHEIGPKDPLTVGAHILNVVLNFFLFLELLSNLVEISFQPPLNNQAIAPTN